MNCHGSQSVPEAREPGEETSMSKISHCAEKIECSCCLKLTTATRSSRSPCRTPYTSSATKAKSEDIDLCWNAPHFRGILCRVCRRHYQPSVADAVALPAYAPPQRA